MNGDDRGFTQIEKTRRNLICPSNKLSAKKSTELLMIGNGMVSLSLCPAVSDRIRSFFVRII